MNTPREHFTRTADEEFSKFDREEMGCDRPLGVSAPPNCGCLSFSKRRHETDLVVGDED
jgi:hypothetical protein